MLFCNFNYQNLKNYFLSLNVEPRKYIQYPIQYVCQFKAINCIFAITMPLKPEPFPVPRPPRNVAGFQFSRDIRIDKYYRVLTRNSLTALTLPFRAHLPKNGKPKTCHSRGEQSRAFTAEAAEVKNTS